MAFTKHAIIHVNVHIMRNNRSTKRVQSKKMYACSVQTRKAVQRR